MEEDDLYDEAVRAVLMTKLGSASMLQRKFGIGYTRASRLIDMMCDHRVVGPHKGSKARELLVTIEEWEAAKAAKAGPDGDPLPPSVQFEAVQDELADAPLGDERRGRRDRRQGRLRHRRRRRLLALGLTTAAQAEPGPAGLENRRFRGAEASAVETPSASCRRSARGTSGERPARESSRT